MPNFASPADPEIIAVVLPDGTPGGPAALGQADEFVATGTMVLVRYADGRLALEPARQQAAWQGQVTSGSSFRSKPILDPLSREVMGYEMELAIAS
jgi:hypothetical protein